MDPTKKVGEMFGRLRGAAKQVVEGYGGVFRQIAQEHGEVDAMMKRVATSPEDSETRRELFPKIRKELMAHKSAEEREFYPLLGEFEQTRELKQRAVQDHQNVHDMLEQLNEMDPNQSAWTERFKTMVDAVQAHVDLEENQIFPKAKEVLNREQIQEMQRRYEIAKTEEMRKFG